MGNSKWEGGEIHMGVMSLATGNKVNICRVNKSSPLSNTIKSKLHCKSVPPNFFIWLFIGWNRAVWGCRATTWNSENWTAFWSNSSFWGHLWLVKHPSLQHNFILHLFEEHHLFAISEDWHPKSETSLTGLFRGGKYAAADEILISWYGRRGGAMPLCTDPDEDVGDLRCLQQGGACRRRGIMNMHH